MGLVSMLRDQTAQLKSYQDYPYHDMAHLFIHRIEFEGKMVF
jgi:hypothetical protein